MSPQRAQLWFVCGFFGTGTAVRGDGGCCTSWRRSIAARMSWSRSCWSSSRMSVSAPQISIKVRCCVHQPDSCCFPVLISHHSWYKQASPRLVSRIWGGLFSTVDESSIPTTLNSELSWLVFKAAVKLNCWLFHTDVRLVTFPSDWLFVCRLGGAQRDSWSCCLGELKGP